MGNENSKSLMAPDKQDKGVWYWQSNKNPWSNEEAQEWTAYPDSINNIIEQAYHQKKEGVDIDGYHLYFVKKLQISKQDKHKQRRIKRVVKPGMVPTLERGDRYCENLPMSPSVNNPYGDVKSFLNFFSNKFPSCEYFLYDLGMHGFMKGRETLIESLRSGTKTGKDGKDATKLIGLFLGKFRENDVLEAGLRAYTEETFLYRRVNELLRNEDWTQMEGLSPYVLMLLRSFTLGEFSPQYSGADGIVLYRGCYLTKNNIEAYDSKLHRYFSWNAITSTTKDKDMAEIFISKPPPGKIATLFVIEAKVDCDPKENINMIDISRYSVFPAEDEVIFAPGTNFEMISSSPIGDNRHEIKLRVISADELRQNGVELVGDFHDRIFPRQESCELVSLNANKIEKAAELLRNNRASTSLTIDSCELGSQSTGKILQALKTAKEIKSLIIKNTLFSLEFPQTPIIELVNALPGGIDHLSFIKNKLSSTDLYSLLDRASKVSVYQVELDSNIYFDEMKQDNQIQVNTEAKLNRVTLRFNKYSADASPRGMKSLFRVLSKFSFQTLEVETWTDSSSIELKNEIKQLLVDIRTISSIENIRFAPYIVNPIYINGCWMNR